MRAMGSQLGRELVRGVAAQDHHLALARRHAVHRGPLVDVAGQVLDSERAHAAGARTGAPTLPGETH